jgi:AAA15 family ATPase/GTPase
MVSKIDEAKDILKALGLPYYNSKIVALTFLALARIRPENNWSDSTNPRLTLTKDIISFVNMYYNENYQPNTRESFRREALNPFVDNKIILLNPDNPDLSPTSPKTHYAISKPILDIIKQYKTPQFQELINSFLNTPINRQAVNYITITNFKSIVHEKIELGRINIFIGSNGCGKSNILEALTFISASLAHELNMEGLYNRGFRVAKPSLLFNSFLDCNVSNKIEMELSYNYEDKEYIHLAKFVPTDENDIFADWNNINEIHNLTKVIENVLKDNRESITADIIAKTIKSNYSGERTNQINSIADFVIYSLNTLALRGLNPQSRRIPLGIYGEGIDTLIYNLNFNERKQLEECYYLFDWLKDVFIDKADKYKSEGYKLGKGNSILYFVDKYMDISNNIFSAENANEGVLHALFYLILFISKKTPGFFSIDNIETALNPRLCRVLIKELVRLSKKNEKQALITTQNPAIIDGLNLLDDEQRLFVISRNDAGHTKIRRIQFKDNIEIKKIKLSEMWMNGLLGAISQEF